jgi:sialate O-acetylesterase
MKDVLVGEVWIGSGQSNMAGGTGGYARRDTVLAAMVKAGPYPKLRLYRGGWKESTAANINGMSALLFSFGQPLQKELDIPVGLIVGAVGGTPSGRWLSPEMLEADAACQALLSKSGGYEESQKKYKEALAKWEEAAKAAKAAGKRPPRKPRGPVNVGDLYARFIKPVVPYTMRGVLWDQGESGTAVKGVDQFTIMGALIKGWRKAWGQGEFPFLYIQKPSGGGCAWAPKGDNPVTRMANAFAAQPGKVNGAGDGAYRELHIRIMQHAKTAMVSASDLGSGIHPQNKSGYGRRACRVALGFVYGRDVAIYGPVYESHKVEGAKVRVSFKHVGKGLAFRGGEKLQGFEIAGADGVYQWADAKIAGATVVLTSEKVAKPVNVRYAWSRNHPWANLFNKDGLPALTFRTGK